MVAIRRAVAYNFIIGLHHSSHVQNHRIAGMLESSNFPLHAVFILRLSHLMTSSLTSSVIRRYPPTLKIQLCKRRWIQ